MAPRRAGVNTDFLRGDDPEADLMGRKAPATAASAPPATPPATPPAAPVARATRRSRATSSRPRRAASRGDRWQRVNVYLEPATQGHWLNGVRGKLLALDRGDIGATEIVRLALDRLAEQLSVADLVADFDRRYVPPEDPEGPLTP